MSYILIDAGNSCLKVAILDDLTIRDISYSIIAYEYLYEDLYKCISCNSVSQVLVSNVNNTLTFQIISDVVYKLWGIQTQQVIVEQDSYGISTNYSNPYTLGSDRWLTLIASKASYDNACCIIDCGTAVTVDVLSESGLHLGGLITPGIKMLRDSLGLKTSSLPIVADDVEKNSSHFHFLANNTKNAILGGTLFQLSAYIERIVSEIKCEFGENIECIITGGDAQKLQPLILHNFLYHETLVLDGLRVVAKDLFQKAKS